MCRNFEIAVWLVIQTSLSSALPRKNDHASRATRARRYDIGIGVCATRWLLLRRRLWFWGRRAWGKRALFIGQFSLVVEIWKRADEMQICEESIPACEHYVDGRSEFPHETRGG